MKRLLVALAAVCAAGAVMAGGVSANPDAGVVIDRGFACSVLDANGNSFITENSTLTLYQNKVVLRCVGDGAGGKPLQFFNKGNTGLDCNIGGFGSTETWSDKVGYNGNSQLVCTGAPVRGDSLSSGGLGVG